MSKKKLNKQDYIFRNRKNELLIKSPGQINGIDFYLANLEDCEVFLFDWMDQILIDDCKNTKIFLGPVVGSVFLRGSENITIASASNQFRISDSKKVEAFVYSKSDPALENCLEISIGPYNFHYPKAREHFTNAKFDTIDPSVNKWSQVYDFTPNLEKRNWSLMSPERFYLKIQRVEGVPEDPEGVIELPRIFGGSSDFPIIVGSQESKENTDDMLSFSITTTAKEAELVIQKREEEIERREEEKERANEDWKFEKERDDGAGLNKENVFEEVERVIVNTVAVQNMLNKRIAEKMNQEVEEKKKRILNAQEDLKIWKKNYIAIIEERKRNNRISNSSSSDNNNSNDVNSWVKIGQNVDFKLSDHKGDREITEMRQALLNKIEDEKTKK